MRPQVGGGGGDSQPLRPRKRSSADLGPGNVLNATAPTSFVLGTEKDVEAYFDGQHGDGVDAASSSSLTSQGIEDSTYGVRSISESEVITPSSSANKNNHHNDNNDTAGTISGALATIKALSNRFDEHEQEEIEMENEDIARIVARRRSTIRPSPAAARRGSTSGLSTISGYTNETSPGKSGRSKSRSKGLIRDMSDVPFSLPMTPVSHASPGPCSDAPPSPRSSIMQFDDELDTSSQAVLSSGEEDEGEGPVHEHVAETGTGGLQLVMPSLLMPSRRPFTERGKQLGRLKILLTGATGTGKTSLIKSIVQTCEDVVHIDSQSPSSSQINATTNRRSSKRPTSSRSTRELTEISGSSKPYPAWWAQVEDSQVLRRRKSSGEEVLERNLCFVDTPGYDKHSSKVLQQMEEILQYLQTQMGRVLAPSSMHDSELLGFVGGAGGSQVDVVLYLFDSAPTSVELEFYEQLSKLAYVIPLLSKSDLIDEESLEGARSSVINALRSVATPQATTGGLEGLSDLYSVCSSNSVELEAMDASLLMSSGYVEPLHPSQLSELVHHLFQPQHASLLKHVTAKKLVAWRHSSPRSMALSPSPLATNLFRPTLPRSASSSSGSHLRAPLSPTSAALTYTSSRLLDHKQREERMAKVHLGHWADSLRRRLAAERMQYETLANAERQKWLQERLSECVFDGKIMNSDDARLVGFPSSKHFHGYMHSQRARFERDLDPLALMKWRRRVLNTLQLVGGFGVVSAVALWFVKTWEWEWEWLDEFGLARLQELVGKR